jgi:hypothetical protein
MLSNSADVSLELFSVEFKTNLANAVASTALQCRHGDSLCHRSEKNYHSDKYIGRVLWSFYLLSELPTAVF